MAGMSSATEIPVFTLLLDTFILKKTSIDFGIVLTMKPIS